MMQDQLGELQYMIIIQERSWQNIVNLGDLKFINLYRKDLIMLKTKFTVLIILMCLLVACGGTTDDIIQEDVIDPNSNTVVYQEDVIDPNSNTVVYQGCEELIGCWDFYIIVEDKQYTLNYYLNYYLNRLGSDEIIDDDYYECFVYGTNRLGKPIFASYSSDTGNYGLLDSPFLINGINYQFFYYFYTDGNKILDNSYCYLVIEGNLTNSRCILKGNKVTALIRSKTENIDPYITFSVEEIEYIENDFTDNLIFNEYIILERLIDMKK